jgi:hypothetical protein
MVDTLDLASLFYNVPDDNLCIFARGSTAFLSVVFSGWIQMSALILARLWTHDHRLSSTGRQLSSLQAFF